MLPTACSLDLTHAVHGKHPKHVTVNIYSMLVTGSWFSIIFSMPIPNLSILFSYCIEHFDKFSFCLCDFQIYIFVGCLQSSKDVETLAQSYSRTSRLTSDLLNQSHSLRYELQEIEREKGMMRHAPAHTTEYPLL